MFLVIFASIYNGKHISTKGGIPLNDYFVPGILAYGVITTTFVNMAISTSILRDEGVMKRMQGTPLPRWAYMAGRLGSTVLIVAAMTALTLGMGAAIWSVNVRSQTLPGLLISLVLGAACFTALGIGIVRYIRNAEAAPPIVNIAVLPLTFISGVWFPTEEMPALLRGIAAVFPVHALANALQYAFDPHTASPGIRPADLAVMAVWLAAGVLLTVRFLRDPEATAR
jgi:ABC-2 type transport system permease protein